MGWFSSDEKSTLATHPVNPDVTTKSASGAEQDRYGQHFASDAIKRGVDRGLDKLQNAANAAGSGAEQDRYASHLSVGDRIHRAIKEAARYQGDGAEQDRYNAHFSPALHSTDSFKALQAAGSVATNGEKNASWFGLGYDGQQRAKLMAGSGMGAEQDRFGSHFGLSKDSVANAAQRVKEGAQDVLSRR